MSTDIYTPYTYLIGWSKQDIWYYGCRFAQNCNPLDLWRTYFTSSFHVKEMRVWHGEPDVIEIRKIFNNEKTARKWETKVLKRLKVTKSSKWLNKTNNISFDRQTCIKAGKTNKGRKRPDLVAYNKLRKNKSRKEIFGLEKAIKLNKQHSLRMLGENNPMYGVRRSTLTPSI